MKFNTKKIEDYARSNHYVFLTTDQDNAVILIKYTDVKIDKLYKIDTNSWNVNRFVCDITPPKQRDVLKFATILRTSTNSYKACSYNGVSVNHLSATTTDEVVDWINATL